MQARAEGELGASPHSLQVVPQAADRARVGVLIDTLKLGGWRKAVLERVLASDNARLVLVIRHEPGSEASTRKHFSRRLWSAIDLAERQVAKRVLHRRLARARGFDPEYLNAEAIDFSDSLAGVDQAQASQTDLIRAAALDVVVDLTDRAGEGLSADLARYGVWRVASRRGRPDRVSPLGFWDYYRGSPLSEIAIVARGHDTETDIAAACYCTFLWSWSINEALLASKAAWLLEDAILRRRQLKSSAIAPEENESNTARGLGHAPALLFRNTARLAADAAERAVSEDRWRILLARGDPLAPERAAPAIIEPPPQSYWADPFVLMRDGRCHIFFEEYFYATKRGVISHISIDEPKPGERLRGLRSTVIMDHARHLSYPFLFTHQGELFMIPESSAAQTIDIWRASDFPHGWTRVASPLRDVSATDTSLLHWDGRWWLFTNIDRSGMNDHRSELHVFHADDPIAGPWTPHAANPVVVDARCARMAGGFLTAADGRPIRCGQVQGRRYGEKVAYRLITELSETAYAETPLAGLDPIAITPGARTHHVAARDGMIIADECLLSPKWKRRTAS